MNFSTREERSPSIAGSLLVWIGTFFFAQLLLATGGLNSLENIGYLPWALSTACLYYYASQGCTTSRLVFGRSLKRGDMPDLLAALLASVLLGVGFWALLVFIDSNIEGTNAPQRLGLVSQAEWQQSHAVAAILCNLLAACVAVPVSEEIVFRGFILQRLLNSQNKIRALLFSALIFGLFHINKNFLAAFIDGLLYAFLRMRTGSLTVPIVTHGLHNAIMTIAAVSFGYSVKAELSMLARLSYWRFELLCGAVGIAVLVLWAILIRRQDRTIQLEGVKAGELNN